MVDAGMTFFDAMSEKGDMLKQVETGRVFLGENDIFRKRHFRSDFCLAVNVPLALFMF